MISIKLYNSPYILPAMYVLHINIAFYLTCSITKMPVYSELAGTYYDTFSSIRHSLYEYTYVGQYQVNVQENENVILLQSTENAQSGLVITNRFRKPTVKYNVLELLELKYNHLPEFQCLRPFGYRGSHQTLSHLQAKNLNVHTQISKQCTCQD